MAAGLLDGINPCAFTTLVFLLSALALAGRSRRQTLWIGVCFTAAVFLTYLAIGAGLLQGVRLAGAFPVVGAALRWLLIAGLAVLAALSLYDYYLVRSGRSKEILLQLPDRFKQRIHRDIRERSRAAGLVASSLALGFLVAVFELACTGQVYFPTLVYLVRIRPDAGSFFYLLLYNLGFILPLGAVFLLAYLGVGLPAPGRLRPPQPGRCEAGPGGAVPGAGGTDLFYVIFPYGKRAGLSSTIPSG